jgi:hypothetical protein
MFQYSTNHPVYIWYDAAKALPPVGVRVLIYDPEWPDFFDKKPPSECVRLGEWDGQCFNALDDGGSDTRRTVTQWMHLPIPPTIPTPQHHQP